MRVSLSLSLSLYLTVCAKDWAMASASVTAALRIRNVVHIGSPSQIVAVAAYLHNLAIEFYVQKQNSAAAAAAATDAATAAVAKFVFLFAYTHQTGCGFIHLLFLLIN